MAHQRLKIAVVVHGRFHAFDFCRALLKRGHDVWLFTNYPQWAVARFDFPVERVKSFWLQGVLARASSQLDQWNVAQYREEWLNTMFGRWAASELVKEDWDVVHSWSGVSEEIQIALRGKPTIKTIMRGSSHIQTQSRLLREEEERTGATLDKPSAWIIEREQREYRLADLIITLSTFSHQSFFEEGVPQDKLRLMVAGANLQAFRPSPQVVEARCERILSGAPLCVLHAGAFSLRKGMFDMTKVVRQLSSENFSFHFVGTVMPEAEGLARSLSSLARFTPKQPQARLSQYYAEADLFAAPTIEDGFQTVLGQASASALPILTTPNGAGIDVTRGENCGWVLPIRNPEALIERLRWCNEHRAELAKKVRHMYGEFQLREWTDAAADFESICFEAMSPQFVLAEK